MAEARDQILWKKFQKGNTAAFEELYAIYADDLIVFGKSITSNNELIKDVLQKLFIDIWDNRNSRTTPKHIKAYLVKSFRNNLIREIQREKKLEGISIDSYLEDIDGVTTGGDDEFIENIDKLKKTIESLPQRQKEIINLRYYQGIKHDEIAEILNINYQSVSNLLARAIKHLNALMKKK